MWFALPAILFVGVFFVIPQVLNLRFAFSNWTTYSSEIKFNGLDNFASLIDQGYLFQSIGVTITYALIAMVAQNGNMYHGLWYPITIAAMTFVIGMIFVKETKDVDIYAED